MRKNHILIVLMTALISMHMIFTILYNMPVTPFTKKYENITNSYMKPLFEQNWNLFAPDPVSTNTKLNVRFVSGSQTISKAEWYDLSSKYHKYSRTQYLHPYLFKNSILTQFENTILKDSSLVNKKNPHNSENIIFYRENSDVYSIYQFVYDELKKDGIKPSKIQIRYKTEYFSSYGRNDKSSYEITYLPIVSSNEIEETRYEKNHE